ncbi:MAG TPA: hypothetical protein VFI42_02320 [Thermomicrobiaceae bacterium]|nr:hypothetical protein [Thermomicrobiaceae bacterium]
MKQPISVSDVATVLRLAYGYGVFWAWQEQGLVLIEPCHPADAHLIAEAASYLRSLGARAYATEGEANRIVVTGSGERP